MDPTNFVTSTPGILKPGQSFSSLIGHSVINISDLILSPKQVEVLEKGLTFCPTPGAPDIVDIWNYLEEFFRRLRIKRYFNEEHTDESEKKKIFKNKSDWSPPRGFDPILETYIKTVKTQVLLTQNKKSKPKNLSKKHFEAIKELSDNKHIVIKKADKGSAVVIINTTDYIREVERQLSQRENYQPLR